jgi:hypothetical protein
MNLKMFVSKSCSQRVKMDLAFDILFLIQVSLFPATEEGCD